MQTCCHVPAVFLSSNKSSGLSADFCCGSQTLQLTAFQPMNHDLHLLNIMSAWRIAGMETYQSKKLQEPIDWADYLMHSRSATDANPKQAITLA